jgi:hypothetical protein
MQDLDKTFGFSESGNTEILFEWLRHVIVSQYTTAYPAVGNFLINVGRRKFVKPLFQALIKTESGTAMAKTIYEKARPNYHSITQNSIDELLAK